MKKIISIMILSLMLLVGCGGMPSSDQCDFLINANWEGTDEQCTNTIIFRDDMSFGNSCACGSPVGDGDLVELFSYTEETKTISLFETEDILLEEGTILFCDDTYLVVNLWGRTYCYQNLDAEYIPEAHSSALEVCGTDKITKPLLTVLGLEDNILSVTSHDYDGDAKDMFATWEVPVADDVEYKSVSVKVENDVASVETVELTDDDIEYIGEYYTGGFFEFNDEGQVTSVIFYGELIIQ